MYLGYARNSQEMEKALMLATQSFREDKAEASVNVKRQLMSLSGKLSERDVIVLVKESGDLCGTCFLQDRFFFRGENNLQGTFLTSICIAESSRGEGWSKILMNGAIAECGSRGSAFAILIARRNVDHFYNQFFFWGLSQYSTVNIKLGDIDSSAANYSPMAVTEAELGVVNALYEATYSSLYGSCIRSPQYWIHILMKVEQQKLQFVVYKIENLVKAYMIFSGRNLHEFAVAEGVSHLELLREFGQTYSLKEVTLSCSEAHPVVKELQGLDFSITQRQCSYGGHMVRVIHSELLMKCLEAEIQNQVDSFGIEQYLEKHKDLVIEKHREKGNITLTGSPYDYENTCLLMGANYLSARSNQNFVYSLNSFNVPLMDQI